MRYKLKTSQRRYHVGGEDAQRRLRTPQRSHVQPVETTTASCCWSKRRPGRSSESRLLVHHSPRRHRHLDKQKRSRQVFFAQEIPSPSLSRAQQSLARLKPPRSRAKMRIKGKMPFRRKLNSERGPTRGGSKGSCNHDHKRVFNGHILYYITGSP